MVTVNEIAQPSLNLTGLTGVSDATSSWSGNPFSPFHSQQCWPFHGLRTTSESSNVFSSSRSHLLRSTTTATSSAWPRPKCIVLSSTRLQFPLSGMLGKSAERNPLLIELFTIFRSSTNRKERLLRIPGRSWIGSMTVPCGTQVRATANFSTLPSTLTPNTLYPQKRFYPLVAVILIFNLQLRLLEQSCL